MKNWPIKEKLYLSDYIISKKKKNQFYGYWEQKEVVPASRGFSEMKGTLQILGGVGICQGP